MYYPSLFIRTIETILLKADVYGFVVILLALILVAFVSYKYIRNNNSSSSDATKEKKPAPAFDVKDMMEPGSERIRRHILETSKIYIMIIQGFADGNEKQLKATCKKVSYLEKSMRRIKEDLFNSFTLLSAGKYDTAHYFIQAMDYLGELTSPLKQIAQPVYSHILKQHKGLTESQKEDILLLMEEVTGFFNYLVHIEKEQKFDAVPEMIERQKYIVEMIEALRMKQIERLIQGQGKTRSSILLLECYAESKNLILFTINLLKAHRDFHKLS
ncbi:hypothetical protein SAMN06265379_103317 [Saccharicrinis carchari]|uniref:Uncharacterized protein n=1 Tax=Saccharicrinis carchari TaxID=1168039 RepID=A0A521CPS9_SACCC|nr:hypothetical protein [Saccharicrinis carchari]SMO60781.1 hypothetical protein SAMN06265379_103317 [Saccharicrinis carchari]